MKKSWISWIGLVTVILLMFSFTACDSGGDDDSEDIPEDTVVFAGNAMQLIGSVLELTMDDTAATPAGMTITRSDNGGTATLTNFSPTTEDPITITGTITVVLVSADPLSLTVSGECTFDNSDFESLSITGSATWASGATMDDEPTSFSGTITIDGTTYTIQELMDAGEELEEN